MLERWVGLACKFRDLSVFYMCTVLLSIHAPPSRSAIHWNAGCGGPCPKSSLPPSWDAGDDAWDEEPDDDNPRSHQDLLQPESRSSICGGGGRGAGAAVAGGAAAAAAAEAAAAAAAAAEAEAAEAAAVAAEVAAATGGWGWGWASAACNGDEAADEEPDTGRSNHD